MFKYLILGLLRDGRVRHGYALSRAYCECSGSEVGTVSFYRELQRLVGDGLIETFHCAPGEDSRRMPYGITEQGAEVFDAWLAGPPDLREAQREDELSARALFLDTVAPQLAHAITEGWQNQLWIRGKVLERARDVARTEGKRLLVALLTRRMKYVTADLEMVAQLRAVVEQPAAKPSVVAPAASRPTPAAAPRLQGRGNPLRR